MNTHSLSTAKNSKRCGTRTNDPRNATRRQVLALAAAPAAALVGVPAQAAEAPVPEKTFEQRAAELGTFFNAGDKPFLEALLQPKARVEYSRLEMLCEFDSGRVYVQLNPEKLPEWGRKLALRLRSDLGLKDGDSPQECVSRLSERFPGWVSMYERDVVPADHWAARVERRRTKVFLRDFSEWSPLTLAYLSACVYGQILGAPYERHEPGEYTLIPAEQVALERSFTQTFAVAFLDLAEAPAMPQA